MISLDINLEKDLLEDLTSRLKSLSSTKIEIGMFEEQGEHYSGFTYAGLFKYLSTGDVKRQMPPRNTLHVATELNPLEKSPLRSDITEFLSNLSASPNKRSPSDAFETTGRFYRDKVRYVFGNSALIAPKKETTKILSSSPETPLIETGDLRSKVAYRINNGKINE